MLEKTPERNCVPYKATSNNERYIIILYLLGSSVHTWESFRGTVHSILLPTQGGDARICRTMPMGPGSFLQGAEIFRGPRHFFYSRPEGAFYSM